jgi:hypothetical protein
VVTSFDCAQPATAEFLHPAWNKQHSYVHQTGLGRDKLEQLQRERIALLEGFDHDRVGLQGLWLAHNAVLRITVLDGRLKADGGPGRLEGWLRLRHGGRDPRGQFRVRCEASEPRYT